LESSSSQYSHIESVRIALGELGQSDSSSMLGICPAVSGIRCRSEDGTIGSQQWCSLLSPNGSNRRNVRGYETGCKLQFDEVLAPAPTACQSDQVLHLQQKNKLSLHWVARQCGRGIISSWSFPPNGSAGRTREITINKLFQCWILWQEIMALHFHKQLVSE
jgi:hypothetical protein